jgi:hypothetical protein
MKVRLLLTLLLVAGGLVFVIPGRASACSCAPTPSFEKAVKNADAVFAGVVTSSKQTGGQRGFLGATPYGNFVYTFEVDEIVAGEVGRTVEVSSHSSGAACGIRFRERARYIVFAYEGRRVLEAFLCSRTERINETIDFGGESPVGKPPAEIPPEVTTGSDPGLVLMGAAALLGVGSLMVLLRSLMPTGR